MGLVRFFARRILLTIPVLVGMSVVVFLLLRLVPGDPAQVILGLRATPEELEQLRAMAPPPRTLEQWLHGAVVVTEEELADLEWFLQEREARRSRG